MRIVFIQLQRSRIRLRRHIQIKSLQSGYYTLSKKLFPVLFFIFVSNTELTNILTSNIVTLSFFSTFQFMELVKLSNSASNRILIS